MLDSPPSAILIESAIKVVWQENVTMATHNPISCASLKKLAKKGRTRALKTEPFCLYRPPVCMSTMVRSKSTAIKLMPAFAIALANRRERWCVFVFFGRFIGVVLCLLRFYCTKHKATASALPGHSLFFSGVLHCAIVSVRTYYCACSTNFNLLVLVCLFSS